MPRRKTIGMFYKDINIDCRPIHKTIKSEKLVVEMCETLQEINDSFHCFNCLWSYLRKKPVWIRLFQ